MWREWSLLLVVELEGERDEEERAALAQVLLDVVRSAFPLEEECAGFSSFFSRCSTLLLDLKDLVQDSRQSPVADPPPL